MAEGGGFGFNIGFSFGGSRRRTKDPFLASAERTAKRELGLKGGLDNLRKNPDFVALVDQLLLGGFATGDAASLPSASALVEGSPSGPIDKTLGKIGIRSIFELFEKNIALDEIFRGRGGGRRPATPRRKLSKKEQAQVEAAKKKARETARREANEKRRAQNEARKKVIEGRKVGRKVEESMRPTPNVPAVIGRGQRKRRSRLPTGREILEREAQKIAGPAAGIGAITGAGILTDGPPEPPAVPKELQGPPQPPVPPGLQGPPAPSAPGGPVAIPEATQGSQATQGPPVPVSVPQPTQTLPPPPTTPTGPPPLPKPSRLPQILQAGAIISPIIAAQIAKPGRPRSARFPVPPQRGPDPITQRQLQATQFLQPQPAGARQFKDPNCEKRKRANRKTCWEGFYKEFPTRTQFVKWTKVDCKTRKIIEEK